ncbi:MBL fold metallo-hydrolase [Desulfurobacterium sp.]
MIVKIAGGYGSKGKDINLVTLEISDSIIVDCGNLFSPDVKLSNIKTILITHSHFDHIHDLPLFIDKLPYDEERLEPLNLYVNDEVKNTLENFIFNGTVWPKLKYFKLPSKKEAVKLKIIDGKSFHAGNFKITPIPVNHTVQTTGFIITGKDSGIAISGDTYSTETFWKMVNSNKKVKAVFIDVSYPSCMEDLAKKAKHYSVKKLLKDLDRFNVREDISIYAYHLKYPFIETIKDELLKADRDIQPVHDGKIIEV